jgi:type IV fimbrial biogenesis protein FimT
MRQLMHGPRPRARGMTLIEVMIAVVITAILAAVGAPFFGDFVANSRLRETGNALMAETLYAQSEAVKRNGQVRLAVNGNTTQVIDMTGAAPSLVRERRFADGLSAETTNIDFGSDGMTRPRGTDVAIDVAASGITCSDNYRCPRVLIDAGGAVRLCGNKLGCP